MKPDPKDEARRWVLMAGAALLALWYFTALYGTVHPW